MSTIKNLIAKMPASTLGFLSYLVIAIGFGFSGFVAVTMSDTFTVFGQVAVRGATIVLIMIGILVFTKNKPNLKGVVIPPLLLFIGLQPFGNYAFIKSIEGIEATGSIFYLYIGQLVMGFIIGMILTKNKHTWHDLASLSLAGVALILFASTSSRSIADPAILFAIICGVVEASKNASLNKMQAKVTISKTLLILYQSLSMVVVSLFLMWTTNGGFFKSTSLMGFLNSEAVGDVGKALGASTITIILVTSLLVYGTKNLKPMTGNVILSSEIIFAVFINILFLPDQKAPEMLGYIAILLLTSALIIIGAKTIKKAKTNHE